MKLQLCLQIWVTNEINAQFRKIKKSDYDEIKRLILDTWKIEDDFTNEKAVDLYMDAFLYDYLAWSNYKIVVMDGNKIAGFLLGRSDKKSYYGKILKYKPVAMFAKFRLFVQPSGRDGLRILRITDRVNRKLMKHHTKDYEGELCLFSVSKEYKGKGYGTQMLERFHEFLKKTGATNYFLYTDTDCNVGFYERFGYELISLDTVEFFSDNEETAKYYMYSKKLIE